MNIILTVQRTKDSWRLGLNTNDSKSFKHREEVTFKIESNVFSAKTACGTSKKKAFDFNSKKNISGWILKNKFHCYKKGKLTKLNFQLDNENGIKTLKYLKVN